MQGREEKKFKKDSPLRKRYLFHLTGNIKKTKCFTTSLHKFIIMFYIFLLQSHSEKKHDFQQINKLFIIYEFNNQFFIILLSFELNSNFLMVVDVLKYYF